MHVPTKTRTVLARGRRGSIWRRWWFRVSFFDPLGVENAIEHESRRSGCCVLRSYGTIYAVYEALMVIVMGRYIVPLPPPLQYLRLRNTLLDCLHSSSTYTTAMNTTIGSSFETQILNYFPHRQRMYQKTPDPQQSPNNLHETIDLLIVYNTFIRWFGGGGGGTSPGIVGGGGGGSSFINTAVTTDFIVLQGIRRQAGEYGPIKTMNLTNHCPMKARELPRRPLLAVATILKTP